MRNTKLHRNEFEESQEPGFQENWYKRQQPKILRSWYVANVARALLLYLTVNWSVDVGENIYWAIKTFNELEVPEEQIEEIKNIYEDPERVDDVLKDLEIAMAAQYQVELWTELIELQNQLCSTELTELKRSVIEAQRAQVSKEYQDSVNEHGSLIDFDKIETTLKCG